MRLLRIPGVYGPCRDSELVAEAVAAHVRPGDSVLDLCSGSGVLAVEAARAGAGDIWAIDLGRRAVAASRLNARLHGVPVTVLRGSLFAPVRGRRFDLILANPPYVPSVGAGRGSRAARAWEGGPDGRRLLDPLLEGLPRHLNPGGRALIVHSSVCDVNRSIAMLAEGGIEAEAMIAEDAPLGPITAPRAEALERVGLLRPGERREATVVIGAVLPASAPPPASQAAGELAASSR